MKIYETNKLTLRIVIFFHSMSDSSESQELVEDTRSDEKIIEETSDSQVCKFSDLFKGQWRYYFTVGQRKIWISGGLATYEDAYGLSLDKRMTLGALRKLDGFMGSD